ncbi:MAG TPA: DNA repair protein RecO, partial [Candidatus Krumholzibacterium sp.]|nr:DNA repair protein RecO [Candidatus Krumholzibacterium sp.]
MSRIIKESAVILKTFDFSESSLIAVTLTAEHGKIRVLAKGARRGRSPFQGVLRTGNIAEIVYYDKGGEGLRTLREAAAEYSFDTAGAELDRVCILQAGIEIVDRTSPERGADEGVFSVLEGFVRNIRAARDPWLLLFWLEGGIL